MDLNPDQLQHLARSTNSILTDRYDAYALVAFTAENHQPVLFINDQGDPMARAALKHQLAILLTEMREQDGED